jgi:flagellar motor switch protein FliN/FliY
VDISPPETGTIDVESVKVFEKLFESPEKDMVKVAFRLKIGNLIDSTMVQLYKLDFCQGLIGMFIKQLKISREKEKNSEKK